jgi:hypothetical protein
VREAICNILRNATHYIAIRENYETGVYHWFTGSFAMKSPCLIFAIFLTLGLGGCAQDRDYGNPDHWVPMPRYAHITKAETLWLLLAYGVECEVDQSINWGVMVEQRNLAKAKEWIARCDREKGKLRTLDNEIPGK